MQVKGNNVWKQLCCYFFALSLLSGLAACGGGGGGASPSVASACNEAVQTSFAGNFEFVSANRGGGATGHEGGAAAGGGLGKVLGGLFTVSDLSDGSVVGSAVTDSATGLVTVRTCARPGPFLLTMSGQTGATYYDEGLNQLVPFPPGSVLHALVDTWNEHVGVSPFTEAAYRYALNNFRANPANIATGTVALITDGSALGLTTAQVQSANNLVTGQINDRVIAAYKMSSVNALPTPLDANSSSTTLQNTAYGRSAAVNGGFVKAASQYNTNNSAPALTFANDLARDLTDGRIDGFALDGTPVTTATSATYESVRLPIGSMVGSNAVTQRFGQINSKKTIDEVTLVLNGDDPATHAPGCTGFQDRAALLSDGTVILQRKTNPKSLGAGVCDWNISTQTLIPNFLNNVKRLSNAGGTVFAIKNDGSVVGWGTNYCGKLDPTLPQTLYTTPQTIAGLSNIVSISSADNSTIALDGSGKVLVWGNVARSFSITNTPPPGYSQCYFQSGSPGIYLFSSNTILQVPHLPNIVEVYNAKENYFARTASGELYAWGSGTNGFLGNGVSTLSAGTSGLVTIRPVPIDSPTLMTSVGRVKHFGFNLTTAFALMQDGSIKAWGDDAQFYLGNGVQKVTFVPTTIPGLTNISIMGVSPFFGLRMVQFDGTAISWGPNIGAGIYTNSAPPVIVQTTQRIRHIVGEGGFFFIYVDSGDVLDEFNATYTINQVFSL